MVTLQAWSVLPALQRAAAIRTADLAGKRAHYRGQEKVRTGRKHISPVTPEAALRKTQMCPPVMGYKVSRAQVWPVGRRPTEKAALLRMVGTLPASLQTLSHRLRP